MRNVKYALQRGVTDKLGNMHAEMTSLPSKSIKAIVQVTLDGIVYLRINRIYRTTINIPLWK